MMRLTICKLLHSCLIFSILCVILLSASACDPAWFYVGSVNAKAVAVELFTYDVLETEKSAKYSEPLPFDFSKYTVQEKLAEEKLEEFMTDIKGHGMTMVDDAQGGVPYDQGIRIIYEDGCFEVASWGKVNGSPRCFFCVYDQEGNSKWYGDTAKGIQPFMTAVANYFETKIVI